MATQIHQQFQEQLERPVQRRSRTARAAAGSLCLTLSFGGFAAASAQQTISTIPVLAGGPTVASTVPVAPPGKIVVAAAASDAPIDSKIEGGVGTANAGSSPTKAEAKVPRYSDQLADLAAEALRSMKDRGIETVGVASVAPASEVTVQAISGPQTQVVGAPAKSPTAAPAAPSADGSTGWTSTVISTDALSDYYSGKAIEVPVAPSTQTILAKLPSDPTNRYSTTIKLVAQGVAGRVKGAKAADLEAVWQRTDDRRMTVILTALAQVGTMYRYTGNQPGGFDCSGLTSYSWAKAGVKIPRTSSDQIAAFSNKAQADLAVGDLLWRPGHIGLYLGVGDLMVHSPQTGKAVEVRPWGKMVRFASPL
jgi:peptidoglycan DL-endopeptidase CwlO